MIAFHKINVVRSLVCLALCFFVSAIWLEGVLFVEYNYIRGALDLNNKWHLIGVQYEGTILKNLYYLDLNKRHLIGVQYEGTILKSDFLFDY